MAEIIIGAAAGLIAAAAGWLGYRCGLKDGAAYKRTGRTESGKAGQEQDALMKKYEAILDYDPYGERV
jgi:hypothetical protein